MAGIRIAAPAKVNLVLRVLDRRPDGYHDLWSIMHTVALTDELTVRRADAPGVRLTCSDRSLPTDDRNLVVRAARAVLTHAGRTDGLSIELLKRIPMGGGLGGGSSDAAATLVALNALLGLGWTVETLAELGRDLGSDVPFFLYAPAALVTGRGEMVSALQMTGERWIVLVNPGFPIATRWAYAELATRRRGVGPVSRQLTALTDAGPLAWERITTLLENDFEAALAPVHPILGELKQDLRRHGAEAALLSGSGATVFGIFWDRDAAQRASARIGTERRFWSTAVPAGGTLALG